jgi:hypothetical protein
MVWLVVGWWLAWVGGFFDNKLTINSELVIDVM